MRTSLETCTNTANSVLSALLAYFAKDGGFYDALPDEQTDGANKMATEQAALALVAYDLFVSGRGALYSQN